MAMRARVVRVGLRRSAQDHVRAVTLEGVRRRVVDEAARTASFASVTTRLSSLKARLPSPRPSVRAGRRQSPGCRAAKVLMRPLRRASDITALMASVSVKGPAARPRCARRWRKVLFEGRVHPRPAPAHRATTVAHGDGDGRGRGRDLVQFSQRRARTGIIDEPPRGVVMRRARARARCSHRPARRTGRGPSRRASAMSSPEVRSMSRDPHHVRALRDGPHGRRRLVGRARRRVHLQR